MSRPLIISDCDEVLLHMVSPFRDWLAETQGVEFRMEGNDFSKALRWQDSGEVLAPEEIWSKLGGFFDTEMHRQTPISGAIEGVAVLREHADVVILTNLVDKRQQMRRAQLLDQKNQDSNLVDDIIRGCIARMEYRACPEAPGRADIQYTC